MKTDEVVATNSGNPKLFSTGELWLICQGLIIWLITGLIVSVFRLIIDQTLKLLAIIYPLMAQHWLLIIPYVAVTLVIVLLLGQVIKGYTDDLL